MTSLPSKRERITIRILCSLIKSERYIEHLIIQGQGKHLDMDFMIKTARIMADKVIEELGGDNECEDENAIMDTTMYTWQPNPMNKNGLNNYNIYDTNAIKRIRKDKTL